MKTAIIEGQYDLIPYAKPWELAGTFPRRYWDIITYEEEDELTAYLAGQPPEHVCERCKRPCKAPYKHCYRCNNYLKVKAKIARG